jgi:hypothetical protein
VEELIPMPFSKLKQLILHYLKITQEVPENYLELGAWMKKYLGTDRCLEFQLMERYVGKQEANNWVVQAMVASGRYIVCTVDETCFLYPLREAA